MLQSPRTDLELSVSGGIRKLRRHYYATVEVGSSYSRRYIVTIVVLNDVPDSGGEEDIPLPGF